MNIVCPDKKTFGQTLKKVSANSLNFILVVTATLNPSNPVRRLKSYLDECVRTLKNGGLLFVQGRPDYLPELGVHLDKQMNFKYWIAIESTLRNRESGLPSVHAGVLLFTKGNNRFNVKRVRFPHQYCDFCERSLKDWGGKSHLMHPDGYVISDVWKNLPQMDNYTQISEPVLETILEMLDFESGQKIKINLIKKSATQQIYKDIEGIIGPKEGIGRYNDKYTKPTVSHRTIGFLRQEITEKNTATQVNDKLLNVVHQGDALEILKQYPDNSIDLVFADPPYNLNKEYQAYDDEHAEEEYIKWCNKWLQKYARILKPTGSLYVLNLPRWTMYHAKLLNQHLFFQNWIVWDAMSEPRGKVMPAHYGLLLYTKHPVNFTFNYSKVKKLDARYYCLRSSCIRKRKAEGVDDKMPLTDIWWDIHRIKHRRDRDSHPCQLPEDLMERIIQLSSNKNDVVLDAFSGAGTTPVTAVKLGRQYVAIDIDKKYVQMTKEKVNEVKQKGYVKRESTNKIQREYTKKELQLELRKLAAELGRLPTPEDIKKFSNYKLEVFLEMFPTWSKALKAAKIEVSA